VKNFKLILLVIMFLGIASCKKSTSGVVPMRSIIGTYKGVYVSWKAGDQYGTVDSSYVIQVDSNSNAIRVSLANSSLLPIIKVYNLALTNVYKGTNATSYDYHYENYTSQTLFQGHNLDVTVVVSYNLPRNTLGLQYDTSYNGTTVGNATGFNLVKQ